MHNTFQYGERELFIGSIETWEYYHGTDWAKNLCHYVIDLIKATDKVPIHVKFVGLPTHVSPFRNESASFRKGCR